jgi:hypothetical protein
MKLANYIKIVEALDTNYIKELIYKSVGKTHFSIQINEDIDSLINSAIDPFMVSKLRSKKHKTKFLTTLNNSLLLKLLTNPDDASKIIREEVNKELDIPQNEVLLILINFIRKTNIENLNRELLYDFVFSKKNIESLSKLKTPFNIPNNLPNPFEKDSPKLDIKAHILKCFLYHNLQELYYISNKMFISDCYEH